MVHDRMTIARGAGGARGLQDGWELMYLETRVTGDLATHSLFQAKEDGSIPIVTLIDCASARQIVEKWHYSKRLPTGKNICFGWMLGGEMYAACVYGIGVNPYQAAYLRKITKWDFLDSQMIELKRCVRVEPKRDGLPLTRLISLCNRWLRQNGYKVVVAFSDPEQGHEGGLYRAGNWTYLGLTNAEWHLMDKDGNMRHRRFAFRYARRNGLTVSEARTALGCSRVLTKPKHRFAIWIGTGGCTRRAAYRQED